MRILFLTQWFDPEPTLKGLGFARALQQRGHEVEVVTGFPNYPGGKVYPGYRVRLRQVDSIDGIRIVRVPLYPSHDTSALGRVANYGSFAVSAAVTGGIGVTRPDIIYAYHPPATIALPALTLSWRWRVPYVLDIQDLWPDTLAATGMVNHAALLRLADQFCRLAYRHATRIVVLSPGFREALTARGVPADKVSVIYNWCDESAMGAASSNAPVLHEAGLAGRFNVVFAGTMGRAQALGAVLDAARLVQSRQPSVQFIFVGGGILVESLRQRAAELALSNVKFLPVRPAAEVAPLLAAADVLLVHLRDDPLFSITIPSKTQAYLAAGRPILMAVRGDAASLIDESGGGITTPPEDSSAMADRICQLAAASPLALREMGERGRAFYRSMLSRDAGVARFDAVFRDALATTARPGRA